MSSLNKLLNIQKCPQALLYLPIRYLAGGVKKKFNPDNVRLPKPPNSLFRGFQVKDGDYVYKGDILVTQVGLEVYPGLNVCIHGNQFELRAMASGHAIISTEILRPFQNSPIYNAVSQGKEIKKPFIHVLEDEHDHHFKVKTML